MYYAVQIVQHPATTYVAGHISKEAYLRWLPFKVDNAVLEEREGWLWAYDALKPKPWERRDRDYRATAQYKEWRKAVFTRDSFTCQSCGQVGGKLEGHHIKTFNKHPKLRFEVSNGKTLCRTCHLLEHSKRK